MYFITFLVLNVLVARFFKAAGSGWIYYVSNFYAFIILVTSLSMESGMGFYASRNEISVKKLSGLSLVWSLVTGVVVLISCVVYTDHRKPLPVPEGLIFISSFGYVCGNLLTNYCSGIFYAKKNFMVPNIVCMGCNLLLIAILLLTTSRWLDFLNAEKFLYIYFISFYLQGILLISALFHHFRHEGETSLPTTAELNKLMRYSFTAFIANIIYFLVYRIDYWFVKTYCPAADLGNYIQVSKLGQMIVLLPSFMASAVFPVVSEGRVEEVNRGLTKLSRIIIIFIGFFCGFLALTGSWIFPLIFGATFSRMYVPFILLVPGLLSISSLFPLAAYYAGKNMIKVNITGSLLALLFIIAADFIFVPILGIPAAALISSIGYMIYHAYVLFIFKNEYNVSVMSFFNIKREDFIWLKKFLFQSLVK